jgi:hypothetical protein
MYLVIKNLPKHIGTPLEIITVGCQILNSGEHNPATSLLCQPQFYVTDHEWYSRIVEEDVYGSLLGRKFLRGSLDRLQVAQVHL